MLIDNNKRAYLMIIIERMEADIERLDNELSRLKSLVYEPEMNGDFNFRHREISADERFPQQNYKTYLEVIESSAKQFADVGYSLPFTISFESNYLTDKCVADICATCTNNDYIKEHLKKLDLRNNLITKGSFSKIIELINECPNLTVDISCNSNYTDIRNDLGTLIDEGRVVYTGQW